MRVEHVLLMGSIAMAGPAMSADQKPTGENTAKPAHEAQDKARPATGQKSSDERPKRPNRKARVHRSFPPPTKPL
ncbi:MAG: hypothetical protein ABI771_01175 [Betaproteobacteria bacterium]